MIKRTIRFKDIRVMLSLYKTLVRPRLDHVEYSSSLVMGKILWTMYLKYFSKYFLKMYLKWYFKILYGLCI